MMNQPSAAQPKADCAEFIAQAVRHLNNALEMSDAADMQNFLRADLELVRINIYLARELLEILNKK